MLSTVQCSPMLRPVAVTASLPPPHTHTRHSFQPPHPTSPHPCSSQHMAVTCTAANDTWPSLPLLSLLLLLSVITCHNKSQLKRSAVSPDCTKLGNFGLTSSRLSCLYLVALTKTNCTDAQAYSPPQPQWLPTPTACHWLTHRTCGQLFPTAPAMQRHTACYS